MQILQLMQTLSFDEFISMLISESARTKKDCKLQLRFCYQKSGEDFGNLPMELIANACPKAVFDFKVELSRDQFLQLGITVSDETRKKLFISQPKALSESALVQYDKSRVSAKSLKAVKHHQQHQK